MSTVVDRARNQILLGPHLLGLQLLPAQCASQGSCGGSLSGSMGKPSCSLGVPSILNQHHDAGVLGRLLLVVAYKIFEEEQGGMNARSDSET